MAAGYIAIARNLVLDVLLVNPFHWWFVVDIFDGGPEFSVSGGRQ